MSALEEAFRAFSLIVLFLVVIPALVFTADLLKTYYKKRRKTK